MMREPQWRFNVCIFNGGLVTSRASAAPFPNPFARPQSEIKSLCLGPCIVLETAGIRRRVVQIKTIENGGLVTCRASAAPLLFHANALCAWLRK